MSGPIHVKSLFEKYDEQTIKRLLAHPELWASEKKKLRILTKNSSKTTREGNFIVREVKYAYKKPKRFRLYADCGFQGMWSKVRNTLCRDYAQDIDIVNSQPSIMLQFARGISNKQKEDGETPIEYNALIKYVRDRDDIFPILTHAFKLNELKEDELDESLKGLSPRKHLKQLFTSMINGGSYNKWIKDRKITEVRRSVNNFKVIDFLKSFEKELTDIRNYLWNSEEKTCTEIRKIVEKNKSRETLHQKKSSFMSLFYHDIEDQILHAMFYKAREMGFSPITLIYDGFMIDKTHKEMTENDLRILEKEVEEEGYQIKLAIKPFNDYFEFEDVEPEKVLETIPDDKKLVYDARYCENTLGNTEGSEEDIYQRKKTYIEQFCCYIEDTMSYVWFEKGVENSKCKIYTRQQITEKLSVITSGFTNRDKPIKFTSIWLDDVNKRTFKKVDFIPHTPEEPDYNEKLNGYEIYNLFQGYGEPCYQEDITFENDAEIINEIKEFLVLTKLLCENDKNATSYMLDYLAHIIQQPANRVPIAFVIKGAEGTGKNVWLNTIVNIIGKEHFLSTTKPKDLFGEYAEGFVRKLIVNINECEGKDTFDYQGQIKSAISDETIVVNAKYERPITINNFARLFVFTNKANPLKIDITQQDRRFIVFTANAKWKHSNKWAERVEKFNSPRFTKALYLYLKNRDIKINNWIKERPLTKSYWDMARLFIPPVALFLKHFFTHTNDGNVPALLPYQQRSLNASINEETFRDQLLTNNKPTKSHNINIKGSNLYKEFTTYTQNFGLTNDNKYSIKNFYNQLDNLDIQGIQKQSSNVVSYNLQTKPVLYHMKNKNWIDWEDNDICLFEDENTHINENITHNEDEDPDDFEDLEDL